MKTEGIDGKLPIFKVILLAMSVTLCVVTVSRAGVQLPNRSLVFDIRESEPRSGDEFELSSEIENIVESRVRIYRTQKDGKEMYVMEKNDKTAKNEHIIWNFFMEPEKLSLTYLQKKMMNSQGKTASDIWYDYENPMFGFPKALCYMYTVPIWLMGHDLKVGDRYEFYILLSYNAAPMHMYADVKSVVKRNVPAGKFDCYLVKLEPDLDSILGKWKWAKPIIGPWVPNYYFWLDTNEPHTMIRFEGKFGPVGAAPTQTYELRSVRSE